MLRRPLSYRCLHVFDALQHLQLYVIVGVSPGRITSSLQSATWLRAAQRHWSTGVCSVAMVVRVKTIVAVFSGELIGTHADDAARCHNIPGIPVGGLATTWSLTNIAVIHTISNRTGPKSESARNHGLLAQCDQYLSVY